MHYVMQIEEGTVLLFESVLRDDNITVNYSIPQQPQYLVEYIEGWRRQIWDHGYPNYFKGHNYFKKGDSFEAHEGSKAAIRRVVYRYVQTTFAMLLSSKLPSPSLDGFPFQVTAAAFGINGRCVVYPKLCLPCRYFKFELEGKGAIASLDLPPFLSSYLDRTSVACMFTAHLLRTYTTAYLSGGGWYLDCTLEFTPPSEVQLRRSLDGKGVVDLDIDEFAGLDERTRQKAIARRELLDKKKEARIQVTLENKEKKASVLAQKKVAKEKEEKGKGKAKAKKEEGGAEVVPSSTTDGGSQMPSAVKRKATLSQLTEEVIMHVTQAMVIAEDDVAKSEDLILNISIEELANDMVEDSPKWFNEVLQFMKKVIIHRSCTLHSRFVFFVV